MNFLGYVLLVLLGTKYLRTFGEDFYTCKSISEKEINRECFMKSETLASYLITKSEPLVLTKSTLSNWSKWTSFEILHNLQADHINGVFKHESNPYFGPFYDPLRPMNQLDNVQPINFYNSNHSLSKNEILQFFHSNYAGPPYYALSTDFHILKDSLESSHNEFLQEMIRINPLRSSVNLWLGMINGTTPCHYDGYHNLYVNNMHSF
jgi:hypothetical protein